MNYRRMFLQALFLFCEERGIPMDKIAAFSNISLQELNTIPSYTISNQQLENIWKNIVKHSKNELIGFHFGATMQITALGVVGQVIQMSNTVKEALNHASSMIHLITDFYSMQVIENPQTFSIVFQKNTGFDNFPTAQNQMGDFLIAFTLYELKGLLMENPKPLKASFPTYRIGYDGVYEQILKCPIKKSDSYILEFRKEYLETKIITANYEIQSLLIEQINRLQNPKSLDGDFTKRIFNFLIANSYLYSLSIEFVAGSFNISVRTLQRKLKQEGVSYLQIVEEVRKSLAIHYIQKSSSSVKEISAILGYSEPSAFVRAFKNWTGKTPSEYRKTNN
ncbi:AraC-like DNA-binding protein [Sphingobacterium soli]|nr:AraC family transcriptional regulator [Sphingobacterium soli]MBA8988758.1 AraC-like DNA-binding protein [Sphingobacterium soli]